MARCSSSSLLSTCTLGAPASTSPGAAHDVALDRQSYSKKSTRTARTLPGTDGAGARSKSESDSDEASLFQSTSCRVYSPSKAGQLAGSHLGSPSGAIGPKKSEQSGVVALATLPDSGALEWQVLGFSRPSATSEHPCFPHEPLAGAPGLAPLPLAPEACAAAGSIAHLPPNADGAWLVPCKKPTACAPPPAIEPAPIGARV